jgi:hypothetical protein
VALYLAVLLIAWLLPPYLLLLQRRGPFVRDPRAPRRRQLIAMLVLLALEEALLQGVFVVLFRGGGILTLALTWFLALFALYTATGFRILAGVALRTERLLPRLGACLGVAWVSFVLVGSTTGGPILAAYVSAYVFWAWLAPALLALLLLRWVVRPASRPARVPGDAAGHSSCAA